jgi:hypothetical protein
MRTRYMTSRTNAFYVLSTVARILRRDLGGGLAAYRRLLEKEATAVVQIEARLSAWLTIRPS